MCGLGGGGGGHSGTELQNEKLKRVVTDKMCLFPPL